MTAHVGRLDGSASGVPDRRHAAQGGTGFGADSAAASSNRSAQPAKSAGLSASKPRAHKELVACGKPPCCRRALEGTQGQGRVRPRHRLALRKSIGTPVRIPQNPKPPPCASRARCATRLDTNPLSDDVEVGTRTVREPAAAVQFLMVMQSISWNFSCLQNPSA
jgi:hypothetical protein